METFSWLMQVLGTPGAWCSIGLQLMKGLLTFWAILASRQLWEQEVGGGAKKLPLWSPNPPWADGAIWHMVNWPPSKMLFSEISPKLEPLKLSLEICPISTSARSPNCQRKLFIQHNQREEKHSFDPGSWRNRPTYADGPDHLQLWICFITPTPLQQASPEAAKKTPIDR